jgi:2-oxoglutarate ferredoxin oxidoreductase subunit beta
MVTLNDYTTKEKPQWCPGCGDFGMVMAIKTALTELGIPPHKTVIASGIGCSGKAPHYVHSYGFETLHGRSVPAASAIKLANHDLTVIAEGGDGDGYGIGMAHFMHVMRRNYDMTYIVHDNQIYGLTTGQASPTTMKGMKSKSTPHGVLETPFNPIATAIASGATFVSRVFAGDMRHMTDVMKTAITHKGFALVDVFQPCVTFNKLNTYQWFQPRVYKLEANGHNTKDRDAALAKAFEAEKTNYEKLPIGIFYQEERATYESQLPQLKKGPLVSQPLDKIELADAYKEFE